MSKTHNQDGDPPAGDDALVVFLPSGLRGHFAKGTAVLQAARSLGVDLDSVCGGRALCGRCQIVVTEGELAKHGIVSSAGSLSETGKSEARYRESTDQLIKATSESGHAVCAQRPQRKRHAGQIGNTGADRPASERLRRGLGCAHGRSLFHISQLSEVLEFLGTDID